MRFNSIKITRFIFSSLSCLILLFLFICIFCNFKSLPQEIGIHFNGHGQYDLTGSKMHVLNYYPIGIIAIIVFELFQQLATSLQIKDNISEDGKKLIYLITTSFIGLIELDICVFIAIMGSTIAMQAPLTTTLPVCCAFVLFLSIVVVSVATICTTIRFKKHPNQSN